MKYSDITSTESIAESITLLTKNKEEVKIDDFRKQYDVSDKRDILNPSVYHDRTEKDQNGNIVSSKPVNRIPIGLQKRIVNAAVSFTFGNPVDLVCEAEAKTTEGLLFEAVQRILADNKIDSFNCRIGRDLARCTEVAECWYPVPTDESHDHYGFDCSFKIKVQQFSPWNGDTLYPYFDSTGDMIAFCRTYQTKENGKSIKWFEVYTDEEKIIWRQGEGEWSESFRETNILKKIPIIYACQDEVEWHDVQKLITRLEKVLSKFGDTNDYFASPIFTIEGNVGQLPDKETTGKVLQLETGAKASFVSWDQAPEAIKLEIETLIRFTYGLTQTPDISFDSVKGLREISGEALKMLFLDAHLKVKQKAEILDEYLQRRINILKAFLGLLNTAWKKQAAKLEIVPKIVPFTISNEKDVIDRLVDANAGKALISQRTAVALSGLVEDVDAEYEQIVKEQKVDNTLNAFPPAE